MDINFAFEIAETARSLRREFDRRAAALGVTRAQWRVLAQLARRDGQRQVDLAEALDLEPITLCRMIDRLGEAQLVERRRDEDDRRAWRIHLTERSRPIIADLTALSESFLIEILDGISPPEQARVLQVLERVRTNIAACGAARRAS